ncbi:Uncharacterised protein [Enterobacter cloacae]|nr:Uncharacterised protein [Enterobacter cloacae]
MADLVSNNRFRFVTAHVLQQAGTDGHQGRVTTRTGSKRVNIRRVVDGYLRHGNARLL